MKNLFLAFFLSLAATQAVASEQECAFTKINAYLKKDWQKVVEREGAQMRSMKTGIVARESRCPPRERSDMIEYMDGYQFVPLGESTSAVLVDSHQCGGGNKHGQYLIIIKEGRCKLVTSPEIGDMAFIGESIYPASDSVVVLKGYKWMPDDAHCCPSKEGTLEYNVSNGRFKFQLHHSHQR